MISGEFSYRSAVPCLFNKVLEISQITALFFDTYIQDNQGSISLEIVKNTDNPRVKLTANRSREPGRQKQDRAESRYLLQ
ncbi:MAG: hypothetical protein GPJ13_14045 [Microcystis aeruginosa W11-06]|nr:hypothetical protein [Microcystis aeruginosa W11-03]NCR94832.1 hypothetical protein [Microcystis aeruginosa W11-06]